MRTTHAHDTNYDEKGPSLARGPAWIVGTVLSVFGLILFFRATGTPLGTDGFPDGAAQGQKLLGFEANAWTAWLTVAAGVLVLIGAAQHVIAKAFSLIVGIALVAAAIVAAIDGDLFGLAAANTITELGWAITGAILIVTALLPRLNRNRHTETDTVATRNRDHDSTFDRNRAAADDYDAGRTDGHVADRSARPVGASTDRDRTIDQDRNERLANDRAADRDRDAVQVDGDHEAHQVGDRPTGRFQRTERNDADGATDADGSRTVEIPPRRS
jgi:hypothetical protein